MYIPTHFREERPDVLLPFIARHPLGAIVMNTPEGLTANHIPMRWVPRPLCAGVLQGHVAHANPIWRLAPAAAPVLVIFAGANHYLTPSWYPAKQEHGKVVPTWNYSVVHVRGTINFYHNDAVQAHEVVSELTDQQEATRGNPWKVSDAPVEYIESQLRQIVVFEIAIEHLIGKFKASQHRDSNERKKVMDELCVEGMPPVDRDEIIRAPRG